MTPGRRGSSEMTVPTTWTPLLPGLRRSAVAVIGRHLNGELRLVDGKHCAAGLLSCRPVFTDFGSFVGHPRIQERLARHQAVLAGDVGVQADGDQVGGGVVDLRYELTDLDVAQADFGDAVLVTVAGRVDDVGHLGVGETYCAPTSAASDHEAGGDGQCAGWRRGAQRGDDGQCHRDQDCQ